MEPRILMGPTHEMDRDCNSEEASANAEFIVRARNAHDDLVAVAEKAKAAFSYLSINGPKDLREEFAKRFRETELALAKAKAGA